MGRKENGTRTLADLDAGERAALAGIDGAPAMKRRLADLGFCEGEQAECVLGSPLGDPRAYLIRGALIALRRRDAERIGIR